ncbi:MAG: magnesium/cobalt transporter CorA [Bacteroidetes bacterium]|nr:magnesium/cobalt transporter CorA [Bacteroidota bacterium]MBU1578143.1 magnesium/cobalt transporter CorA [Bacteroidota bacterium]MBU2557676.1 magnesium/cobalt transporter CorA [Bacteroidota bacterium]
MKIKKKKKTAKKLGKPGSSQKAGLPPGSLVHIGQVKTKQTSIDMLEFDTNTLTKKTNISVKETIQHLDTPQTSWIKITGLQDTATIEKLGKQFDLHPLLLEDILNTGQRPKTVISDDYLFLTMKTLGIDQNQSIVTDQISFILRKNLLISFHESELPLFDSLYQRLEVPTGRLRTQGPDYLFYALIDLIVDHYFYVIEYTANELDKMEDALYVEANEQILENIQQIRKELLFLKKAVFPLREALGIIIKSECPLIHVQQIKYLNDVQDHVLQIYETIENYRELNAGLKDMYLSDLSHKMNKVMQVLTIIATIFIPLTFIAGIYGMNFEFMPELSYRYGYPIAWTVMIGIAIGMLIMFRKNKWL